MKESGSTISKMVWVNTSGCSGLRSRRGLVLSDRCAIAITVNGKMVGGMVLVRFTTRMVPAIPGTGSKESKMATVCLYAMMGLFTVEIFLAIA